MSSVPDPPPLSIPPPSPVKASAVLVGLQAVGMLGFVAVMVVSGLNAHNPVGLLLGQSAYFVVVALFLAACGWALWRGRRWGRTPVLVVQGLTVLVGVWMIAPSGQVAAGAALIVAALVTGGLLLTKPANAWVEKFPIPGTGR